MMKVIVNKEILQNETDVKEKILSFIKTKKIPKDWAINLHENSYTFEYLDSDKINIFGTVDDDYIEMIIGEDELI